MRPFFTHFNLRNGSLINTVISSYVDLTSFILSYSFDLIFIELSIRIMRTFYASLSIFIYLIPNIIHVGAQKQMLRINTGWVIAPMEAVDGFRYTPKMNHPRRSMRSARTIRFVTQTITLWVFGPCPLPTIVCFKYLREKFNPMFCAYHSILLSCRGGYV